MKMKLSELEFLRLLPQFMQEDPAVKALSLGVDIIIPTLAKSLEKLTTWDQIDNLNEGECDEMAWELDIDWYDSDGMTLEEKRETIKMAQQIKRKRGTKWAVERLISAYFGVGYVVEWYDIGTAPYTFAVMTTNPTITAEAFRKFVEAAKVAKNERSHIVGVYYFEHQGPDPGIEYAPTDAQYVYEFIDCGTVGKPATIGIVMKDAVAYSPSDAHYVYTFPRYGSYGMNSVVGSAIVGVSVVGGTAVVEGEGKCGTYPRLIMTGGGIKAKAAAEPTVQISFYDLPKCGYTGYRAVVGTAIVNKSIVTAL